MAMNALPLILLAGGAAALATMGKKKKVAKKRPSGEVEHDTAPGVIDSGKLNGWGWRVRHIGGQYLGEILAPGASVWQPVHTQKHDKPEAAKVLAIEGIEMAKKALAEEETEGGVVVVAIGEMGPWRWRVRQTGPSLYLGETLAPGARAWAPAHSEALEDYESAKLFAEELIAKALGG